MMLYCEDCTNLVASLAHKSAQWTTAVITIIIEVIKCFS